MARVAIICGLRETKTDQWVIKATRKHIGTKRLGERESE
jgi:hypothetical protein